MEATKRSTVSNTPYWWEGISYPASERQPPGSVDLVIIGAGYTGLSAAIEASRLGMSVVIVDRGAVSAGCSSRNGGQVSDGMKPSLATLSRRHGADVADRVFRDAYDAVGYMRELVQGGELDVDYQPCGRFLGAHSERQFRALSDFVEDSSRHSPYKVSLVQRRDQQSEIASDRYFGGIVNHDLFAVHPGKLHAALVSRAVSAGTIIVEDCPAYSIERNQASYTTRTSRGTITSRHVLVATNGYPTGVFPWGRRRVIPIGTYMLATEDLSPAHQETLIPNGRNIVDSKKVVIYFRYSPDRKKLLFGGRAALTDVQPERCLSKLYKMMVDVFPQLNGIGITHNWHGLVGYTFDHMPHIGCYDGIHFALGYCGSGIATSNYYGYKIARQIAEQSDDAPAIYNLPFPTVPFYTGKPWFLAPSIVYYRLVDRYFS